MDLRIFGITLVIIGFFTLFFSEIMKKVTYKKLEKLLLKKQYDEFFLLLHSRLSRYLFAEYNIAYMELNAYFMIGKYDKIHHQFQKMIHMRTNKKQRKDLILRAFNFYMEHKKYEYAKDLIKEINTWEKNIYQTEANLNYDIFALKKYCYIDQIESNLDKMKGSKLGYAEYLLSVQYDSKGDKVKSTEYLNKSKIHLLQDTE